MHSSKIGQGEGGEELSTRRSLLSSCFLLKKKKKKTHAGVLNATLLTYEIVQVVLK
jgi:hypothetical protein